ncbi:MAG: hypothetical protein D6708_09930 [Candidatus Dadabacteria bacterium]|nr:MAG: hypothetical protein D6708_09930 [Candidatus Dadabacteria bacterium]
MGNAPLGPFRFLGAAVIAVGLVLAAPARGQEYRIDRPSEPESQPVHLTAPVEGTVEVTNLPPVQDVRVVGGALEGPVPVQGTVEIRTGAPLPVEVTNPAPAAEGPVEVQGTVAVDDRVPLRVVVTNPPPAPERRPEPRFAAFSFEGVFRAGQAAVRRTFTPPEGQVFHATGLVLDARTDAFLRLRLLAEAGAVAGDVVGAPGAVPLGLLDSRVGPTAPLSPPVPLRGAFVVEVEAPAGSLGAPFRATVTGYLRPEGP